MEDRLQHSMTVQAKISVDKLQARIDHFNFILIVRYNSEIKIHYCGFASSLQPRYFINLAL
jgi:hypothetical protein